jgi:mono/diheme cytochrome c family protein
MAAAACSGPPEQRHDMPFADAARGRQAIDRVGCAACHTIAGVDWPEGQAGPRLGGLSDRALIAGRVPNTPENLAAFIRNAPALVPGSTMPAMPISEREARDIAAYLYRPRS